MRKVGPAVYPLEKKKMLSLKHKATCKKQCNKTFISLRVCINPKAVLAPSLTKQVHFSSRASEKDRGKSPTFILDISWIHGDYKCPDIETGNKVYWTF